MLFIKFVIKSLLNCKVSVLFILFIIVISVMLLMLIECVWVDVKSSFSNIILGIDLIVGVCIGDI